MTQEKDNIDLFVDPELLAIADKRQGIAKTLYKVMQARGYEKSDVATLTGLSASLILNILRGGRSQTPSNLKKIDSVLGTKTAKKYPKSDRKHRNIDKDV